MAIPAAVPVDTARDMRVIATAGHVDHGKSSLVLALTGTDPDRFEEEKRRGLTIDLGFAHAALPSGAGISIVDVPGHVRFLRNMLAGVGGVDATLFVVAATEGWKPQSEEHLRILELLGVRHGIVALTKVDLVDDEWAQLAALDVADHVAGTFLDGAAIVPVASTDGRGLDELRHELDRLVTATPAAVDRGRPRLWVDRAFAARGSGTVVTGTLTGGTLAAGDAVVVEPGGRPARIRSIQTLGHGVTSIGPGHRTALNLAGISHDDIARGDAVVTPGRWATTTRVDAHLDVLASLDHEVSRRGAYMAYVGSREVPARLRVLGSSAVLPGAGAPVRLFLADALPLLPGDRFVLRESGRDETVGGGEVLDIAPVRPASKASPDRSIERVVRERGWVTVDDLELLTGERVAPTVGRWVVTPDALETATADVRSRVAGAGLAGLDVATLDERERALLDELADRNEFTVDAGRARTAGTADPYDDHPFVRAVRDGWFSPPDADASSVARNDVRELVRRGQILERDGVVFHRDAVDAAAQVAARLLAARPQGYTMGEFRDALGTTRKHALPLAALLDAGGVTRRRDDVRIAGPRLPAA